MLYLKAAVSISRSGNLSPCYSLRRGFQRKSATPSVEELFDFPVVFHSRWHQG